MVSSIGVTFLIITNSLMYTMSESMTARGGQYEIGRTCWWTDCILRIEEE